MKNRQVSQKTRPKQDVVTTLSFFLQRIGMLSFFVFYPVWFCGKEIFMAFSLPPRHKIAQHPLWNLFLLTLGAFVYALGVQAITVYHGFVTGGAYGTGLLIWYATDFLTPSLWFGIITLPLFIISWFWISKAFFFYSLFGSVAITFFTSIITFEIPIENDLYAAVVGGLLCGAGTGIQLRSFGSGGGLDLIGVILNRKWNIGIGRFSMSFNGALFIAATLILPLDLIIVSFIQIFISANSIDYVLRMFSQRKMVFIISEKGEEIVDAIIAEGYAGATLLKGKGGYSGTPREVVLTVTNNIMLRQLENVVFEVDSKAFFVVENTFYVSGTRIPRKSVI